MRLLRKGTASGPVRMGAALAAMALVVAACGTDDGEPDATEPDDDDTEEVEDAPDDDAPGFLTMATGSTGGTYFPLGGAMAGVWNDNIPDLRVSTQSSGASVENLRLLSGGEVELIMAVNGTAASALAGDIDDLQVDELAFLGNVYGEVTQVVARADSGIESIEDMAGQRIQIGPPGSGTEVAARTILEAAGIDPDNDIEVFQDAFGDAVDSLRDGVTDAAFGILALPHGGLFDAANSVDMNFIPVEGDLLDGLLADDETLSALEVEAGTYPGQDTAVTWTTNWATLYSLPSLHEDTAYEIVRVLYEHNEDIANAHAVGNQIQLDTAVDGRAGIPVHPGAERFYTEHGIDP